MAQMEPGRKARLLAAAAAEFTAAGYEHASLNRIIRACRMSKSSFYHYFDSKAALFDAVVTDAVQALAGALSVPPPQELAGPEFWDRLAALVHQLLGVLQSDRRFAELGTLMYLPDAPVADSPAIRGLLDGVMGWVEEVIRTGRGAGVIGDDLPPSLQMDLAVAVLQAMDRWSVQHWDELGETERRRLADHQVAAVRRLLAP